MESVAEPLAPRLESMVTDQETQPLTPVSGTKIINEHIEPSSPAPQSIPFKADVLVPVLESILPEAEVPTQEDSEAPMAGPVPVVLKGSVDAIVEEPLL